MMVRYKINRSKDKSDKKYTKKDILQMICQNLTWKIKFKKKHIHYFSREIKL